MPCPGAAHAPGYYDDVTGEDAGHVECCGLCARWGRWARVPADDAYLAGRLLDVVDRLGRGGVAPSRRGMAYALGCSPGAVHAWVWAAVAMGILVQRPRTARAVRLTAAGVLQLEAWRQKGGCTDVAAA